MKKINLEEIFANNSDCYTEALVDWKPTEEAAMSKEKFITVVKDVCKQALELAAKNAVYELEDNLGIIGRYSVQTKDAVINTINQIE